MKSKSLVVNLKRLFFGTFIIQAAFFVSFAFKWIVIPIDISSVSVGMESYALLFTLIGIPGALKLFSVIMNKNKHPEDVNLSTELYKKAYLARFGILFLIATLNILLYAFSYNQNFMLLTLITFTTYIFSYPSTNYLSVAKEEEEKERSEETRDEKLEQEK